jgi:hypothetical protein
MKKVFFILALLSINVSQAAEIVEVRIKIPMSNDESRIKDYYLSTDGQNLKENLVVKVVRSISVVTVGKKNLGDLKVEIGQLRIMAINDKVAVAREYKLHSKENAPLTESLGFMIGDQIDTTGSFIDKNPRKPSSDDGQGRSFDPGGAQREVATESQPSDDETHPNQDKAKVQVFPGTI